MILGTPRSTRTDTLFPGTTLCRSQATTLVQLKSLLDAIVRQFGFRWFALVHNVDLKRTTRKALLISTYPARWVEEVIDARLHLDDPVHVACAKTVSEIGRASCRERVCQYV